MTNKKPVLLSIFIAICGILFFALRSCGEFPSDRKLAGKFEKNTAQFEQLIEMIRQDLPLRRVDDDWTDPHDLASVGISEDRIAAYRKIFRTLGIDRGFEVLRRQPLEVFFIVDTSGLLNSGAAAKGYVYKEVEPSYLEESLDVYSPSFGKWASAYKLLSGKWYLYFEYTL